MYATAFLIEETLLTFLREGQGRMLSCSHLRVEASAMPKGPNLSMPSIFYELSLLPEAFDEPGLRLLWNNEREIVLTKTGCISFVWTDLAQVVSLGNKTGLY